MEVDVQVEAAAEALHERDGRELGVVERDRTSPLAVALAKRAREGAKHFREEARIERGARPHVEGQREDPLALRVPVFGQRPRALHENATSTSWWHVSQRARVKP